MPHFHARTHSEADTATFRARHEMIAYLAGELDRVAEYQCEMITDSGEHGEFEDAYRAYVLFETYAALAANAHNVVRNAALSPSDRAPLYREEPQFGPLWTVSANHVTDEINTRGPRDFAFTAHECEYGDTCDHRPGAWVITGPSMGDCPRFAASEWRAAWDCYMEFAREWADASDEEYALLSEDEGDGTDQGADRATVDSILADDGDWAQKIGGHTMTVHANDGQTVLFELRFDPDAEPATEDELFEQRNQDLGSGRVVSSHSRPSGAWCRWSGTGVTSAYGLPGCPDECPDSTVVERSV